MSAIEVTDLKKSYGSREALRGVSFSVQPGEVVGFLGPNGAGKSTAMKILTGYISPTSGSARIDGFDVLEDPLLARSRLGYLPEHAPLYLDMRVIDYLRYMGEVRGLARAALSRAIDQVATDCGITERLYQEIGSLSKGYRQRTGLAQAMLHSPPILILDEPTTGLDPNQIVEIRNLIRELGRSRTVLLSTHILSEVQATCDRVIIIHRGERVADGATSEITDRAKGGQLLRLVLAPGRVRRDPTDLARDLAAIPGVERISSLEQPDPNHSGFEVLTQGDLRSALFRFAVEQGVELLELAPERSSLEEVFRRLTGNETHSA